MKNKSAKALIFLLAIFSYIIADLLFLKSLGDISFLIGNAFWILLFIKYKCNYEYFLINALTLFVLQIFFVFSQMSWLKDRVASWIFFLLLFSCISSVFIKDKNS